MDRLPAQINLIVFDAAPPTALCASLTVLGVMVEQHAPHTWFAGTVPPSVPQLFWLGHASNTIAERVGQRLLARHHAPALAVFDDENCELHRTLCGACTDFVRWPVPEAELALRLSRLGPETDTEPNAEGASLLGEGTAIRNVRFTLSKVANCDAPVLITGETGTGKELAARTVHYLSARRGSPFIAVNCGALPAELIENELFGHQRGAYTDAQAPQAGLIEEAHRGTLFLDEVGTLNRRAQSALLRFLQTREYRRLGGGETLHADVRIVSATNADLRELARRGEFREDLLFRLDILGIHMPPLCRRLEDIPLLVEHFLRRFRVEYQYPGRRLGPGVLAWLCRQEWPGNVRQLENTLRRGFLLAEGNLIGLGALTDGDPIEPHSDTLQAFRDAKARHIDAFEREYLESLMRHAGGNVTRAAELAGKERRALGKLLKKHGFDRR
jgi:DNA-binding NtrC family response regulator